MIIAISGKINNGKDAVGNMVRWLTNPRIITDPSVEVSEDNIASYQSFQDFEKEYGDKDLYTDFFKTKKFADKLKDTVCLWLGCTREQLENREFKESALSENWWVWEVQGYNDERMIFQTEQSALEATGGYYKPKLLKTTPRKILQLLGTDCGRNIIHPNIWVNATMQGYDHEKDNWLITDCRFPNEADAAKAMSGITIRVNRPIDKRFPEIWANYISTPFGEKNQDEKSFMSWLQTIDRDMYNKLNHPSETSLDDYQEFDYVIENDGSLEDLITEVQEILEREL